MNRSRWLMAGVLAGAGWAGTAWGQAYPAQQCLPPRMPAPWTGPSAPPTWQPQPPGTPQTPQTPTTPPPAPEQQTATPAAPAETGTTTSPEQDVGGAFSGNFAAAGVGGTAGASGAAGTGATDATASANVSVNITTVTTSSTPLVLPGLFTASEAEGALPVDRVFFSYGYFDRFRVGPSGGGLTTITGVTPAPGLYPTGIPGFTAVANAVPATRVLVVNAPLPNGVAGTLNANGTAVVVVPKAGTVLASQSVSGGRGFNLNRYEVGLEKTFLDGAASFYVRAPYLDATDNTSNLPIDGAGDVSAGIKYAFLADRETGSSLTAGFTASAPTARDTVITTVTRQNASLVYPPAVQAPFQAQFATTPSGAPLLVGGTTTVQTTRINPTYLQPWTAGLLVADRLFVQEYVGAIVPTDLRIPVYLNDNLVGGYEVYRGAGDSLLTSVTPFVGAQALIPVSGGSFHFPDQVFLSAGLGVRMGERFVISGSYVVPVVGPRAFENGATVSINYLF